jgi:hypothetical protein
MTEQEPQWYVEREDERIAHEPIPTRAEASATCQREADGLTARLAPLIEHQATMLCERDGSDAELHSLDFIEKQMTASAALAELEFAAGNPEAALRAQEKADNARRLYESKAPIVAAHQERLMHWPFAERQDDIDSLSARRDQCLAYAADPTDVINDIRDKVLAAKDRIEDRTMIRLKPVVDRYSKPTAEDMAKTAEFNALMREPAPVAKPVKRTTNAAAVALGRMQRHERVASPVQLGVR